MTLPEENHQVDLPTFSRAAVVTAGVVENVIIVALPQEEDNEFTLKGSEIVLLADDAVVGNGWLWDGNDFQEPEPEEEDEE